MRNAPCGYNAASCSRATCRDDRFSWRVPPWRASVAAVVATTAQSSTDRWWTGYGSGADHSRYVPSKQVTRANVGRLQVAWTYPFGDTGSGRSSRAA